MGELTIPTASAEAIASTFDAMSDADKSTESRLCARRQIEEDFSIERMVNAHSECWTGVAEKVDEHA